LTNCTKSFHKPGKKANWELENFAKAKGVHKSCCNPEAVGISFQGYGKNLRVQFVMKYGFSLPETARMLGIST